MISLANIKHEQATEHLSIVGNMIKIEAVLKVWKIYRGGKQIKELLDKLNFNPLICDCCIKTIVYDKIRIVVDRRQNWMLHPSCYRRVKKKVDDAIMHLIQ